MLSTANFAVYDSPVRCRSRTVAVLEWEQRQTLVLQYEEKTEWRLAGVSRTARGRLQNSYLVLCTNSNLYRKRKSNFYIDRKKEGLGTNKRNR